MSRWVSRDIAGLVRSVEQHAQTWEAFSAVWLRVSTWSEGKIATVLRLSQATTPLGARRVVFRQARAEMGLKPGEGGIPGGGRS